MTTRVSTASSVTNNRIKTDYHAALEGFAEYYFDVFPRETGNTGPTTTTTTNTSSNKSNSTQRLIEFREHLQNRGVPRETFDTSAITVDEDVIQNNNNNNNPNQRTV